MKEEIKIGFGGIAIIMIACVVIVMTALGLKSCAISTLEPQAYFRTVQNVDAQDVSPSEECDNSKIFGENSHAWKAQNVEGQIVVFCKKCGKEA